jgi:hypothetical protein
MNKNKSVSAAHWDVGVLLCLQVNVQGGCRLSAFSVGSVMRFSESVMRCWCDAVSDSGSFLLNSNPLVHIPPG